MLHLRTVSATLLAVFFVTATSTRDAARAAFTGLERVATGLDQPVFVTHAPGDPDRLFILERAGAIKILDLTTGLVNATNFLTLGDVDTRVEGGLLGLAFHPDYQNNGRFFTYSTVDDAPEEFFFRSHIREHTVSANPDIANPGGTDILVIDQPRGNHNAGWMDFSPRDGYLYIMSGDGGQGAQAQRLLPGNKLGKALRLDVDGNNGPGGLYGIPADNPFIGVDGDDELWAYGLRNPYRASFDRQTGDLWIGDVGGRNREEIDFQPASSPGGENYGWLRREGFIETPDFGGPLLPGDVDPVYDYVHVDLGLPGDIDFMGASVVGGYIYRGPDPGVRGTYFFADTVFDRIWTFDPADPIGTVDNIVADIPPDVGSVDTIVSFGEDYFGNLYIVDASTTLPLSDGNGEIYRLVTDATALGDFDGDGDTDIADLMRWQRGGSPTPGSAGDLADWRTGFGTSGLSVSAATATPEPASAATVLVGLLIVSQVRGRSRT